MKSVLAILFALITFHCFSANATTETELKVTSVGSWAQGNKTFYFTVDRVIGPAECRSTLVKVDLYSENDSQAELMSKNMVRSMALAAFASESNVKLSVKDTCLYNNPTIQQIWLTK